MPFWILDFRFWIGNRLLCLGSINPSVVILFEIGINFYQTEFRTQGSEWAKCPATANSMNSVQVGNEYWLKASGMVGEKN
ncbi:MAG: hypothetical protein V7K39_27490 [Nostoc sp.]